MSQEGKMSPLDFLNPITAAVQAVKAVVELLSNSKDRQDSMNKERKKDLDDLLKELSKTHATIVDLVEPLRSIGNDPTTFAGRFEHVYNRFSASYHRKVFINERTHCRRIEEIRLSLENHKPLLGSQAQWDKWHALNESLKKLGSFDEDIIEEKYKPFLDDIYKKMKEIKRDVDANHIPEAIAKKNAFLDSIDQEYNENKAKLDEMDSLVGRIRANL